VTRLSRYQFQARQAERYRDGRILLAGDAAHQFPATGIGINFGMLDAVNLAWKLAAVIGGWAPAGLLGTYHNERHFGGARALLQTQAQVALRRGQDPAGQALRELFLELLGDEQPLRRIGALMAGTDTRYPIPGLSQHALTGTFAPDLALDTSQDTGQRREAHAHRHPHRPNRSPASRRPADPPGRPHRLGREHRRTCWHRRARAARSAVPLVRRAPESGCADHRPALLIGPGALVRPWLPATPDRS
jgi:hypothetical protein